MLAVLVAVLWGCNFVAIHVGLADVPPFLFLAIRFVLVAFPLVFFVARPKASWQVVVAVGFFMSFGQFGLLYLAMDIGMPAGLAALVLQAQVIFTILIAAGVLGERASCRQGIGAAIGTAGLAIVAWGFHQDAPLVPLLVTIGAALSWAIGNVVARAAKVSSGLSLVVWSALVVPLPALAVSLTVEGPAEISAALGRFGMEAWVSTLYTVVLSSLVGYTIFNGLMAKYPAASVVPFILLVPPVGVLSAWVALDEVPSALEWVGGIVMMVGVAVATVSFRSRAARRATSTPAAAPSSPR
nr:EamA family transporter [Aeromicrobium phoceense]